MKKVTGSKTTNTEPETEITVPETELEKEVAVDGINITGMSREEAKAAILKDFPWGMKVTWQDQSYDVNDLMAEKVDSQYKKERNRVRFPNRRGLFRMPEFNRCKQVR